MDLRVTIRTRAVKDFVAQIIDLILVIQRHSVSSVNMASLAEERDLGVEQLGMVGAMGFVAVRAVFPDRYVVPEKRTSFLGVAFIALLVDGGLLQQFPGLNAVGIVAIRTGHFSLSERMMRGPKELGLFLLMAGETQVGLAGRFELRFFRLGRVHAVAVRAGEPPGIMDAPIPGQSRAALMAGQADFGFFAGAEGGKGSDFCFISVGLHMLLSWTVACFAGFVGTPFESLLSMEGGVERIRLFLMARGARFRAGRLTPGPGLFGQERGHAQDGKHGDCQGPKLRLRRVSFQFALLPVTGFSREYS